MIYVHQNAGAVAKSCDLHWRMEFWRAMEDREVGLLCWHTSIQTMKSPPVGDLGTQRSV